jgi:L-threonylcarbamoyladenylate synthase
MPEVLSLENMEAPLLQERCRDILAEGGLVILPTDTVYGLAARADIHEAVERVFEVKGREEAKALVVMVSSLEEAVKITAHEQRDSLAKLGSLWPGPLTLVVMAGEAPWKESVAPGSETLGIRIPDSPFVLQLLRLTGPLAVTSANPAGESPPVSFTAVDSGLLSRVELAVDAGDRGSGRPSTVAEIRGDGLKILRHGDIGFEELYRAMEGG